MGGFVVPLAGPNAGFPGTVSRNGDELIVNRPLLSTDSVPAQYGGAAILNPGSSVGGYWSSIPAAVTAGVSNANLLVYLAGIFTRNFKVDTTYPLFGQSGINQSQYLQGQLADVLERGVITVQLAVYTTACTAGGQVFIRTVLNGAIPAGVIGGFETAADGGNTIAVPTSQWAFKTGFVDPNGRTEIVIKNRINV
jgi:hypothetical protein